MKISYEKYFILFSNIKMQKQGLQPLFCIETNRAIFLYDKNIGCV